MKLSPESKVAKLAALPMAITIGLGSVACSNTSTSEKLKRPAAIPNMTTFVSRLEAIHFPLNNRQNIRGQDGVVELKDGRIMEVDLYSDDKAKLPAPSKVDEVVISVYPKDSDIHQEIVNTQYNFVFVRGVQDAKDNCCPLPGMGTTAEYDQALTKPSYSGKLDPYNQLADTDFTQLTNYKVEVSTDNGPSHVQHVSRAVGKHVLAEIEDQALSAVRSVVDEKTILMLDQVKP